MKQLTFLSILLLLVSCGHSKHKYSTPQSQSMPQQDTIATSIVEPESGIEISYDNITNVDSVKCIAEYVISVMNETISEEERDRKLKKYNISSFRLNDTTVNKIRILTYVIEDLTDTLPTQNGSLYPTYNSKGYVTMVDEMGNDTTLVITKDIILNRLLEQGDTSFTQYFPYYSIQTMHYVNLSPYRDTLKLDMFIGVPDTDVGAFFYYAITADKDSVEYIPEVWEDE